MNKASIIMTQKASIFTKILAIFLVGLLFLAACNNSIEDQSQKERSSFQNQNIDQDSASNQLSGSILLWHDETINQAQAQQTVRNYQQINPDVNIVVEIVPKEELLKRFLQKTIPKEIHIFNKMTSTEYLRHDRSLSRSVVLHNFTRMSSG